MNTVDGTVHTVPVEFVIRSKKQKFLLQILCDYSQMQLTQLSALLDVPIKKMYSVIEGESYFTEKEVELLVRYFCIYCGD